MIKLFYILLPVCIFFQRCGSKPEIDEKKSKPNIVYILADDLGYGDLGCYGQQKIKTPNLDKMAQEGMRFTHHYSGSTVCAPSRSSLLTGQHTGHTHIRRNRATLPEGQFPLKDESFTIAEMLKQSGYKTGAFGKWGLGFIGTEGDPNNQGFNEFFGYNCQSHAHRYYPTHLWDNGDKVILEENDGEHTTIYAQDVIHDKALEFIDENKDDPFFLFLPYVIPHAELIVPEDSILDMYRAVLTEDKPYRGMGEGSAYDSNWIYGYYCPQPEPHATYAAMISRLDMYVGNVLEKLAAHGLSENTLVIFSSDNGPDYRGGADPEFFNGNGGLRGFKRDLYEGGIRVPMIALWEGKIKAGTRTDHISTFWDVMPTLAELIEIEVPESSDGISFLPTLFGIEGQDKHDHLYWEHHGHGGKLAVRKGNWKAVRNDILENPESQTELYEISSDFKEERNVAEQYPEVVKQLEQLMSEAHTYNSDFPLPGENNFDASL